MDDIYSDEIVHHGIDDSPNNDAKKGLGLGALGGGAVGAIAGAALGPVGAVVGALIGGSIGSVASGAAVQVVDAVDNDNTVSGVSAGMPNDLLETNATNNSNTGSYVENSTYSDVHAGTPGIGRGVVPGAAAMGTIAGGVAIGAVPGAAAMGATPGNYERGTYSEDAENTNPAVRGS